MRFVRLYDRYPFQDGFANPPTMGVAQGLPPLNHERPNDTGLPLESEKLLKGERE
jgi:hypothetical protein